MSSEKRERWRREEDEESTGERGEKFSSRRKFSVARERRGERERTPLATEIISVAREIARAREKKAEKKRKKKRTWERRFSLKRREGRREEEKSPPPLTHARVRAGERGREREGRGEMERLTVRERVER